MRSAEITISTFGPDPRTALERLFADLLAAIEESDAPVTIQARVTRRETLHAAEPPRLDRLEPPESGDPEGAFIAEGKAWCRRPTRPPKLYVSLVQEDVPALPSAVRHEGGNST